MKPFRLIFLSLSISLVVGCSDVGVSELANYEETDTTETSVLPFFVSFEGLLRESFAEPGDYLLPLPRAVLQGGLRCRAAYSDVIGFSRSLLGCLLLRVSEGQALLYQRL